MVGTKPSLLRADSFATAKIIAQRRRKRCTKVKSDVIFNHNVTPYHSQKTYLPLPRVNAARQKTSCMCAPCNYTYHTHRDTAQVGSFATAKMIVQGQIRRSTKVKIQ